MSYRRSRTRRRQYDAWNIDPGTYDVAPTVLHAVDSVKVHRERTASLDHSC